uniref:Uncharacterized protein n=1 Tax=Pipistrellus kuhlii TaxID=59472 RepID=A0A7J7TA74_PIPKU|nr:hypothetical protein mPipKuh1_009694 [Pipistrellus kuhlii]
MSFPRLGSETVTSALRASPSCWHSLLSSCLLTRAKPGAATSTALWGDPRGKGLSVASSPQPAQSGLLPAAACVSEEVAPLLRLSLAMTPGAASGDTLSQRTSSATRTQIPDPRTRDLTCVAVFSHWIWEPFVMQQQKTDTAPSPPSALRSRVTFCTKPSLATN